MKSKIFSQVIVLSFLIIFSQKSYCQYENSAEELTYGEHSSTIYPNLYFTMAKNPNGTYEQWSSPEISGSDNIGNNFDRIYRARFDFLNKIPKQATILSVTISYTTTDKLGGFNYVNFGFGSPPNTESWNSWSNSTYLGNEEYSFNGSVICNSGLGVSLQNSNQNIYTSIYAKSNNEQLGDNCKLQISINVAYYIPFVTLKVTNNFNLGHVKVGVLTTTLTETPVPYTVPEVRPGNWVIMEGVEENIGTYFSAWGKDSYWDKTANYSTTFPSRTIQYNYTASLSELDVLCTANMQYGKSVSIQLAGSGGKVNVTQYNTTSSVPSSGKQYIIASGESIELEAIDETKNGIDYVFQMWSDETTTRKKTVWATSPGMSACFSGYPNVSMMNVQSNCLDTIASPRITWTDNPNANVSYKTKTTLYRKDSPDYIIFNPSYIAKGTQYFSVTSLGPNHVKGTADMLSIELYALYSIEATEKFVTSKDFTVRGQFPDDENPPESKRNAGILNGDIITKYSVANYPNPFNPTTVINYQVPETGYITLKVYDVMGKEIATLVEGVKAKGDHNINFSMDQYHLASGIYFCRLSAGKNVVTTKMILSNFSLTVVN